MMDKNVKSLFEMVNLSLYYEALEDNDLKLAEQEMEQIVQEFYDIMKSLNIEVNYEDLLNYAGEF